MDYLHRIFGIYSTRQEAEQMRQQLIDAGFRTDQVMLLDEPGVSEHTRANSDEVRNETIVGGTVGTVAGGAAGALGEAALAAANVSLFLASPVIGTLTMIGWGAAAGGVIGALAGAGKKDTRNFAKLVDDALEHGHSVLIVYTQTEAQTTQGQALIAESVRDKDMVGKASD